MKKHLLEFFGFKDIIVLMISLVFATAMAVAYAKDGKTLIFWLFGVALFLINEYLTHRFIFHMKPPKHPFFLRLLKRLHYDHHVDPDDLKLLFLPIWYSLPQMIMISAIVFFVFGDLSFAFAMYAGLSSGLLYYEWTHFVAHRPIKPITRWGKWMKKVHIWHHFKNEGYWFGVSNPSMDYLMGTFKDEKEVPRSENARNLLKNME
ncbi:sterol desaturase family protein [Thermolongibacillus altinsuensis]|jgi:4-hydroxysphinganine ceramide fatty acyl 2-hydroxylase|uniref:sterol desaturase family protein n=1 Tax=Thermolongibacillus altinsuensis TaxID=575256 RepID=UPI00242A2DAA|nr:sterol desaturase family protein [Thermolongibacillus altinsuensis]GMB09363.1 fatty acid hydroxylase [Thermolongibacillus altinsuensis]